jgi:hypothetical protein
VRLQADDGAPGIIDGGQRAILRAGAGGGEEERDQDRGCNEEPGPLRRERELNIGLQRTRTAELSTASSAALRVSLLEV